MVGGVCSGAVAGGGVAVGSVGGEACSKYQTTSSATTTAAAMMSNRFRSIGLPLFSCHTRLAPLCVLGQAGPARGRKPHMARASQVQRRQSFEQAIEILTLGSLRHRSSARSTSAWLVVPISRSSKPLLRKPLRPLPSSNISKYIERRTRGTGPSGSFLPACSHFRPKRT